MQRLEYFYLSFFVMQASYRPRRIGVGSVISHAVKRPVSSPGSAEKGITALFGPLPYQYRVFFHRSIDPNDPVPWAHTWKGMGRDVHFHVDTSHAWDTFKDDWTAPHELTHLMFPYLGDSGAWFSEGIASYLQYQIMYANNSIDWSEGIARYKDRFRHARSQGRKELSIVDLSREAGKLGLYVRLYWGGAVYFMQVDKRLYEERRMRLTQVIRQYMHCCYKGPGARVATMIKTFDRISNSKIFTETYYNTVAKNSFPDTKEALAWLSKHPPILITVEHLGK
jgi:hypothetical protein